MSTKPILVTASTGKTGRRVAQRLAARNWPVRHGARASTPPFDWEDQGTWEAALNGVQSVYIAFYPDLAIPSAPAAVQAFTDLAAKSGVQRLVLLSGRGETVAQVCEDIVRNSGLEWTVLRATWFAQNFGEGHFLEPILSGEVALPVDGVKEPFVDVDDIADVAVAALTEDRHAGQLYELTGPRLWTFPQAIAEIAAATQRDIRFTTITPDQYRAAMESMHWPADLVELVMYLFSDVLDGRNASLTDGVQRALGRPPRDFADYVNKTAATGVWKV